MLKLGKISEKPEPIRYLKLVKFLLHFFFFAIVFIVKNRRVGEELETGWLKIVIPMREVLVMPILQMRRNKVQRS